MDMPKTSTFGGGDKDHTVERTQGAERQDPVRPATAPASGYGGLEDTGGGYGAWV